MSLFQTQSGFLTLLSTKNYHHITHEEEACAGDSILLMATTFEVSISP